MDEGAARMRVCLRRGTLTRTANAIAQVRASVFQMAPNLAKCEHFATTKRVKSTVSGISIERVETLKLLGATWGMLNGDADGRRQH